MRPCKRFEDRSCATTEIERASLPWNAIVYCFNEKGDLAYVRHVTGLWKEFVDYTLKDERCLRETARANNIPTEVLRRWLEKEKREIEENWKFMMGSP